MENHSFGVNIVIKGTNKGVVTDANGQFSIDAENGNVLIVSSVGFASKEIKVAGRNNLVVGLDIKNSPLDEVQIIAYGTTSQRFNTEECFYCKGRRYSKTTRFKSTCSHDWQNSRSFYYAKYWRCRWRVQYTNVRGKNSINSGNEPLYIIDGIPFASHLPPNLGAEILQRTNDNFVLGGGNPLNFISLSDIESISVLKDADATSIYGSRGTNGVILITTKREDQVWQRLL